jgi:uncharacterized protein YjgD (DUF1641 family)
LLDEIEDILKEMKKKIEDEYLSSMSSMTMIFIIGLFAFTGFTAFKVNKSLAKSHMI